MHDLQLDISNVNLLREHTTPDESKLTEGVGHKQSHPHNRRVSTARPRRNQKLNV